ncbi:MAG: hypothetical protein JSV21_05275 [Nitrospirota bacterium]|nr:MAG: hypothetical protein JSV21_05275 [Nitrospirota bacterium]
MQLPETRVITQFLFGLMLIFGGMTLIPKSLFLLKQKSTPRAVLYLCLGSLCFFLAIVAFLMAFDKI